MGGQQPVIAPTNDPFVHYNDRLAADPDVLQRWDCQAANQPARSSPDCPFALWEQIIWFSGRAHAAQSIRITQRNPMWQVAVSIICGCRAAGR